MLAWARMRSNEGAAIASLRATNSAQLAYQAGCGAGQYTTSYLILGPGPRRAPPGTSPGNSEVVTPRR